MSHSDDIRLPLELVPDWSEHVDANSKSGEALSDLMRSMILRVIEDLRGGGFPKADAINYLKSEEDDYIFSFRAICEHFGIDAKLLRDAILERSDLISTRRRAAA